MPDWFSNLTISGYIYKDTEERNLAEYDSKD